MRNLKKFLALVLAMLMIVGAMSTVSAFDDVAAGYKYEEAINDLSVKKIINGYDETTFDPEGSVVRWQMALMIAKAITGKVEYNWKLGYSEFIDVDTQDQFPGAIAYVADQKIITGVGENKFEPKEGITLRDGLIMAVRALKQDAGCAATGANYWVKYYNKAITLGLLTNLEDLDPAASLTRAQTAQLIFNLINADRADSDLTFAAECFGIADVANTTVYVLTATANQSYAGSAGKVMDAAYVALQPLNADSTLGNSVLYVKAADLGIADADAYVGTAFGLINFDAKTEKFSGAIVVSDSDVYASTQIAVKDGKVTINNKPYYLVAAETDSLFKNELVMLKDGTVAGEVTYNYLTDADGKLLGILGTNGKVANFIGYSEGVEYFATADAPDTYVTKENLPAEYKKVAAAAEGFVAMNVADLGTAYQITVFDDDTDGVYDRAIYAPVYTSMYKDFKDNIDQTVGPWTGVETDADKKLHKYVGSELTAGDLFTYTYNAQTKVITVIEEISYTEGKIESFNFDAKTGAMTLVINGANYKLASAATEAAMGSKLFENATLYTALADTLKNTSIKYSGLNGNTVGSTVQYYAKNGLVIYMAAKPGAPAAAARALNRVVLKNITNWDSTAIYGDIVYNGTAVSNAKITQYWDPAANKGKGAYVAFSSLTQAQLMIELSEIVDKYVMNAKSYLPEIYDGDALDDGSYGIRLESPVFTDDIAAHKFYELDAEGVRNFAAGVMNTKDTAGGNTIARSERLRTNSATKFVFIAEDGTVTALTGLSLGKDDKINATNVTIIANKIGWQPVDDNTDAAKARAGIASEVYVLGYTKDDVTNFGGINTITAPVTNPVVYIPATAPVKASTIPGSTIGTTDGKNYDVYVGVAVKLADLSTVSTFYIEAGVAPQMGYIYEIDSKNILSKGVQAVDGDEVIANSYLTGLTIDVIDLNGEYFEIYVDGNNICDDLDGMKISALKSINYKGTKVTTEAADVKKAIEDAEGNVALINSTKAKNATTLSFIILDKPVDDTPVVPPVVDPEEPEVLTANAFWAYKGETRSAIRAGNGVFTVGAAIDVDVEIFNKAIGEEFTTADKSYKEYDSAVITVVDIAKRNDSTGVYASVLPEGAEIAVVGSYSAGDLTIDGIVYTADGDNYALAAGRYNITVAIDVLSDAEVTFNVTIQN